MLEIKIKLKTSEYEQLQRNINAFEKNFGISISAEEYIRKVLCSTSSRDLLFKPSKYNGIDDVTYR